jgi:hypothetical protein
MRTGFTNQPGIEYDEDKLDRFYAEDMQAIADVINAFIANPKWKINGSSFEHDADTAGDPADADIYQKDQDKDLNIYINDGGVKRKAIQVHGTEGAVSFLRQSYVLAQLITTDQNIGNSTVTTVIFNSVIADTLSEYNNTTGIFTAKIAGKYLIVGCVEWAGGNDGVDYELRIVTNQTFISQQESGQNGHLFQERTVLISLAVGDTVKIQVNQYSGGNELILSDNFRTVLSIIKVA